MALDFINRWRARWENAVRGMYREAERAYALERERDALQAAIDRAYSAMGSSAYVGGPTEREVWHIVADALGPLATQHISAGEPASPKRTDPQPGGGRATGNG